MRQTITKFDACLVGEEGYHTQALEVIVNISYNTCTYNRPTSVHVYLQFFKCPRHHIL